MTSIPIRTRALAAVLLGAVLVGFVGTAAEAADTQAPQEIDAATAARYAVHAMMASNAYHDSGRVWFPLELLGWQQIDAQGRPTSQISVSYRCGLAYDIWRHTRTGEVVLAFRGSHSVRDHCLGNFAPFYSPAYSRADKEVARYRAQHPGTTVTLTGHSLGGGLALGASARFGVDAVVFDSSPRLFARLGAHLQPATRVMVYQSGEALETLRKLASRIHRVVPKETTYRCRFDFGGAHNHRMDLLALGLLELGAEATPSLRVMRDAVESPLARVGNWRQPSHRVGLPMTLRRVQL